MILDVFGGPGRRKIDEYLSILEPDVVHYQETYGFGGAHPSFPTVFTVHGFDSLNLRTEKKYLWRLRSPMWKIAERIGISSQNYLVSIAPYVTEMLESMTSSTITPIPNAVSQKFFSVPDRSIPGRIFFAGWINNRKNLLGALKCLRLLCEEDHETTLHAAGAFVDSEYLDSVKTFTSENGLESNVRLLGRVGQDRLREELSEASVFLLPSYQENAPMAIAEAMAAGVPVVTSNVCGMPDMIDHGSSGFLAGPDDVTEISLFIRRIVENESVRSDMAENARAAATLKYHPRSVVEKTLELYRSIID